MVLNSGKKYNGQCTAFRNSSGSAMYEFGFSEVFGTSENNGKFNEPYK